MVIYKAKRAIWDRKVWTFCEKPFNRSKNARYRQIQLNARTKKQIWCFSVEKHFLKITDSVVKKVKFTTGKPDRKIVSAVI